MNNRQHKYMSGLEKISLYQLENQLIQCWQERKIQKSYQTCMLQYFNNLPKSSVKTYIYNEINRMEMYEQNYQQIRRYIGQRQKFLKKVLQLIGMRDIEVNISDICEMIREVRKINLLIVQTVIEIGEKTKKNGYKTFQEACIGFYNLFDELGNDNEFLKSSILKSYITFTPSHDLFFLYKERKNMQNSLMSESIEKLFDLSVTQTYRLIKAKKFIQQISTYYEKYIKIQEEQGSFQFTHRFLKQKPSYYTSRKRSQPYKNQKKSNGYQVKLPKVSNTIQRKNNLCHSDRKLKEESSFSPPPQSIYSKETQIKPSDILKKKRRTKTLTQYEYPQGNQHTQKEFNRSLIHDNLSHFPKRKKASLANQTQFLGYIKRRGNSNFQNIPIKEEFYPKQKEQNENQGSIKKPSFKDSSKIQIKKFNVGRIKKNLKIKYEEKSKNIKVTLNEGFQEKEHPLEKQSWKSHVNRKQQKIENKKINSIVEIQKDEDVKWEEQKVEKIQNIFQRKRGDKKREKIGKYHDDWLKKKQKDEQRSTEEKYTLNQHQKKQKSRANNEGNMFEEKRLKDHDGFAETNNQNEQRSTEEKYTLNQHQKKQKSRANNEGNMFEEKRLKDHDGFAETNNQNEQRSTEEKYTLNQHQKKQKSRANNEGNMFEEKRLKDHDGFAETNNQNEQRSTEEKYTLNQHQKKQKSRANNEGNMFEEKRLKDHDGFAETNNQNEQRSTEEKYTLNQHQKKQKSRANNEGNMFEEKRLKDHDGFAETNNQNEQRSTEEKYTLNQHQKKQKSRANNEGNMFEKEKRLKDHDGFAETNNQNEQRSTEEKYTLNQHQKKQKSRANNEGNMFEKEKRLKDHDGFAETNNQNEQRSTEEKYTLNQHQKKQKSRANNEGNMFEKEKRLKDHDGFAETNNQNEQRSTEEKYTLNQHQKKQKSRANNEGNMFEEKRLKDHDGFAETNNQNEQRSTEEKYTLNQHQKKQKSRANNEGNMFEKEKRLKDHDGFAETNNQNEQRNTEEKCISNQTNTIQTDKPPKNSLFLNYSQSSSFPSQFSSSPSNIEIPQHSDVKNSYNCSFQQQNVLAHQRTDNLGAVPQLSTHNQSSQKSYNKCSITEQIEKQEQQKEQHENKQNIIVQKQPSQNPQEYKKEDEIEIISPSKFQIKMKPTKLTMESFLSYPHKYNIKGSQNIQNCAYLKRIVENKNLYLTQFYQGNELVVFGICSPYGFQNYLIHNWCVIEGKCTNKMNIALFKRYLSYIEKFTTCKKIYIVVEEIQGLGEQLSPVKSSNEKVYEHHRKTEIEVQQAQMPNFFYIQLSNIRFERPDNVKIVTTTQIEQFSKENTLMNPQILEVQENPSLMGKRRATKHQISSISEVNEFLMHKNFDTYEIDASLPIKNFDLGIVVEHLLLKENFISQDNYFIIDALIHHQSGEELVAEVDLKSEDRKVYVGKGLSQIGEMTKKIGSQSKERQKVCIKMFYKQLYGEIQNGCFGNWEISFVFQNRLQGKVLSSFSGFPKFGPGSYYLSLFVKNQHIFTIKVSSCDML